MTANTKKSNNYPTLRKTKEQIISKIWRWLPKWLRLTIAFITLIIPIFSTQTYWFPFFIKQFTKPSARFYFTGLIYLERNLAIELTIQLLDEHKEIVAKESSDSYGYIVFNIPKNKKITIIRWLINNQWQEFIVDDAKLKSSKSFNLFINDKRIEWH
jgi:hypothetical protein